jgi:hypothetical protein
MLSRPTGNPHVEPRPSRYSVDADLSKILEEAGGIGPEETAKETSVDELALEKLTTQNAQLADTAAKVLPESPWYLAILMVALIGVLVGSLILLR